MHDYFLSITSFWMSYCTVADIDGYQMRIGDDDDDDVDHFFISLILVYNM